MANLDISYTSRRQDSSVPVVRELPADLETPVSVFLKLGRNPPSFLLESVEGGEHLGRYSFIGTDPYLILETFGNEGVIRQKQEISRVSLGKSPQGADPLHLVQALLAQRNVAKVPGLPAFFGGAVGYLAYDVVRFFERLPQCSNNELRLPDSTFLFTDTVVIFDHVQHKMKIVSHGPTNANDAMAHRHGSERVDSIIAGLGHSLPYEPQARPPASAKETPPLESNFTRSQFADMVRVAKEYIMAGDIFQVVLSQRLRRRTSADPFSIYRALRMLNPSPYMFYFDFGGFQLIGSSPEMLVKLE
ncbi:MAG: chorismate-binding protein, partial [Chloroflexi bacterium]|nr:chorismate-binding protein [Chloroflexota bacterium]